MSEEPNIGGRPTIYSQEVADAICEKIATIPRGLRVICKDEALPSVTTIMRWLHDNETFREQYARAKELQADLLVEEMLEIADDDSQDEIFIESEDKDGKGAKRVMNGEFVQRSRVRIDTRKWLAGKLRPKKYGDKLDVTTDGEKINNTIPVIRWVASGDGNP
jgi:hypothetical protein